MLLYTATAAGTGTGAVTEAGILNASSSGTLLCRTEFSVVNKGSADSMTITWTGSQLIGGLSGQVAFKNNAKTTLSSGVNTPTTTIPVTDGGISCIDATDPATMFFS